MVTICTRNVNLVEITPMALFNTSPFYRCMTTQLSWCVQNGNNCSNNQGKVIVPFGWNQSGIVVKCELHEKLVGVLARTDCLVMGARQQRIFKTCIDWLHMIQTSSQSTYWIHKTPWKYDRSVSIVSPISSPTCDRGCFSPSFTTIMFINDNMVVIFSSNIYAYPTFCVHIAPWKYGRSEVLRFWRLYSFSNSKSHI